MNACRIGSIARRALCVGSAAFLVITTGASAFAAELELGGGKSKKGDAQDYKYTLQLDSLSCKESMTDKAGEKDAVTIVLRLTEKVSTEAQPVTTIAVICREGARIPLEDAETNKPIVLYSGPLKSDLELTTNIYVALPKGFSNVRDALKKYAAATGTTLQTVGAGTGEPGLVLAGTALKQDEVKGVVADALTEVWKAAAETTCKDRVKWTKGSIKTKKRAKLLAHANQGSFKLKGFKKKQWCLGIESGKIKYDLNARLVKEPAA